MRLLFIDKDPDSARALHSEFLEYRGLNWSLSHCTELQNAIEMLDRESFQAVLYRTDESFNETKRVLDELVQTGNCPPMLTVTSDFSEREQLKLVRIASDDCLNRADASGISIMRRLRMAELRKSIWDRQAAQVVEGMVPGFSIDEYNRNTGGYIENQSGTDKNSSPKGPDPLCLSGEPTRSAPRKSPVRKLRVAHVCRGVALIDQLQGKLSHQSLIRYESLDDVLKELKLSIHKFDALIVEQSAFEEASETTVSKLGKYLAVLPSLVLTLEKSDFAALSYLERGFGDCLVADHSSMRHVGMAIRRAVVRRRRSMLEIISKQQVGPGVNDRRQTVRGSQYRRRHVRFFLEKSLIAIPVLPNGAPDLAARSNAVSTDLSLGGLGLIIPHRDQLPSRNWIIGLQHDNGRTGYVNAYLRRVAYEPGKMIVGLIFQSETADFLGKQNLCPTVDPISRRFGTNVSQYALDQWVELGVLKKRLVRRTRTCPECEAVCSVGTGCCQCGSFELQYHDLIHHFACAHVNTAGSFEKHGSIQCPKCLCNHLVVGADFELIRSQYECHSCDYQGDATAQVGCCLNCQLRFPLEMAPEVEVYGYDVERLDILALVDTARHAVVAGPAPAAV